jgi:hypothetical protein
VALLGVSKGGGVTASFLNESDLRTADPGGRVRCSCCGSDLQARISLPTSPSG